MFTNNIPFTQVSGQSLTKNKNLSILRKSGLSQWFSNCHEKLYEIFETIEKIQGKSKLKKKILQIFPG